MKTVIFDLDGTLCDISHRLPLIKREKPDWPAFFAACDMDAPKHEIIQLFKALNNAGHPIILVSGRSDESYDKTFEWLFRWGLTPTKIVMRKHGDHTPDDKLKRSWLHDGTLPPKEEILFCVDDRQRVVDMWRSEGLTCLQVEAWSEE